MDNIVLKFTSDISELKPTIEILNKMGQIPDDMAAQFEKVNKKIVEQTGHVEHLDDSVVKLSKDIKTIPKTIIDKKASDDLKTIPKDIENITKKSVSLKTELRSLKASLAEMEMAGKAGSKEFLEMSIRAGELEDQIGDVANRVKVLASDTKYIDAFGVAINGVAGAFSLATGAAALFGGENEELQAALLKVNAAMAIQNGLQGVMTALNKDEAASVVLKSQAQRVYNFFIDQTTGKLNLMRVAAATAATAGTALLIYGLIKGYQWLSKMNEKANENAMAIKRMGLSQEQYAGVVSAGAEAAADASTKLLAYLSVAQDTTKADGIRSEAIKFLNENYEMYNNQLNLNNISMQKNNELADTYIKLKYQQAIVDAYASVITEKQKTFIDAKTEAQEEYNKSMMRANRLADDTVAKHFEAKYQEEVTRKTKKHDEAMKQLIGTQTAEVVKLIELQTQLNTNSLTTIDYSDALAGLELKMKNASGDVEKQILIGLEIIRVKKAQIDANKELGASEKALQKSALDDLEKYYNERQANIDAAKNNPPNEVVGMPLPEQLATDVYEPSIVIAKNFFQRLKELSYESKERQKEDLAELIAEYQKKYGLIATGASMAFDVISQASAMLTNNEEIELQKRLNNGQLSDKQYERLSREAKHKEAVRNKVLSVFNSLLAIPEAFLNGLADGGPILGAVYAGLATAQSIIIAGTKIPAFAKGTKKAPAGYKLVGEAGPELIKDDGGYPILNHADSMQLMNIYDKYGIDASIPDFTATSSAFDNAPQMQYERIDYDELARVLANEYEKNPKYQLHFDERGFTMSIRKKNSEVELLNKKYPTRLP